MRAGALLLAVLAVASPAAAQEPGGAIARARAALRDADPARAVRILEHARETDTDPEIDRELSIAREQAGDPAGAADSLEAYLDGDPDLDPEARRDLEGLLADLRARAGPPPPGAGDAVLEAVSWIELGLGFVGLVTFAVGLTAVLALESGRDEDCLASVRYCPAGLLSSIDAATDAGWVGLGAGLPLLGLGLLQLALLDRGEGGGARSLPPDLSPSLGPVSLRPWVGPQGAGLGAALSF